jgi:hypothetical protein
MPQFRNISPDTRWVSAGGGRTVKVEPGELVEITDENVIAGLQLTDTHPQPLFEAVTPPAPKKPAPAGKE